MKVKTRKSTVRAEVYFGLVHFISCFYCLAVIPQQMERAGYDARGMFFATATCSGLGSIICGLFANLPFVFAPPTVVSIYLAVYLRGKYETMETESSTSTLQTDVGNARWSRFANQEIATLSVVL